MACNLIVTARSHRGGPVRRLIFRYPLIVSSAACGVIAAGFWAAAFWVRMPASTDRADLSAASTATIIAAMCLIFRARRIQEKRYLVDLMVTQHAEVSRLSAKIPTQPMPELRPVHERALRPVRAARPGS